MTSALLSVRKHWPNAVGHTVGDRPAVGVDEWLAVRFGGGWIAVQARNGTWYAPLPKSLRSGGAHTSFSREISGLQTPVHRTAAAALRSVLEES